ncbi:MAG: glutamine-synthetase adenylyltransferase, partial [Acetobacteraceae bacterium]|nr:glutamine-synthetase adenylyltransferase [Acetobacteraceae bacterium]
RMLRELPPEGPWDLKAMPGGLVEVEFIAQALQVRHGAATPSVLSPTTRDALARLGAAGLLPAEEATALVSADRLWREVIGVMRLTVGRTRDAALPAPAAAALLRIAAPLLHPSPSDLDGLRARMQDVARAVRAIFERRVGAPSGAGEEGGP